jgi:hypothetical protein
MGRVFADFFLFSNYFACCVFCVAVMSVDVLSVASGAGVVRDEGFFNGTAVVTLRRSLSTSRTTLLSFRTCRAGQILAQTGLSGDAVEIRLRESDGAAILAIHPALSDVERTWVIKGDWRDNKWHTVGWDFSAGVLWFVVDSKKELVESSTSPELHSVFSVNLDSNVPLVSVGRGFEGCLRQGPNVVFDSVQADSVHVDWDTCLSFIPYTKSCGE